jgi:hypothetical protein
MVYTTWSSMASKKYLRFQCDTSSFASFCITKYPPLNRRKIFYGFILKYEMEDQRKTVEGWLKTRRMMKIS